MAFLTAMAKLRSAARWFDEKWQPQFDKPEWKKTLTTYVDLMKAAGPPGASSNGFNENLALFNAGKCAMWIDATVAASFVTNPKESKVADKVGFAHGAERRRWARTPTGCGPGISPSRPAPRRSTPPRSSSPGRPARTTPSSSPSKEGWANVPPGTRTSLYQNPEYQKVAPFAKLTLASIDAADPNKPTVQPVPLRRRAVRGDPRVPGHRHRGRPAILARRCREPRRSTPHSLPRNPRPNAK